MRVRGEGDLFKTAEAEKKMTFRNASGGKIEHWGTRDALVASSGRNSVRPQRDMVEVGAADGLEGLVDDVEGDGEFEVISGGENLGGV